MGKCLIIKGADFSENGMAPVQYYFPYDIEDEIIDDSMLNSQSLPSFGRYSVSKDLYDEYLAGKTVVGVKLAVKTAGTLSFYKQDAVNGTAELFETLTFEETGWVSKRFSRPILFDNGIYLSIMKRPDDAAPADTGAFAYAGSPYTPQDVESNVRNVKFARGSGGITNGSLNNSVYLFGICFECLVE